MEQITYRLRECSDEALCCQVAAGSCQAEEELVLRYTKLVHSCARAFFLIGGDKEDLIQEGMLGLLSAMRSYDPSKAASFRTFAEICIRRRLISAVRTDSSGKHNPLNSYISFETPSFDRFAESIPPVIAGPQQKNPEDLMIRREELQEYLEAVKGQLSGFEAEVLEYFLDGSSYRDIAIQVNRSTKSVDNAVQRIRKKFAQQLAFGGFSVG